ncbi:MAG TPA: ATP-binding protein [Bryobacteraceae bacterium]
MSSFMFDYLSWLSRMDFLPRGNCYLWQGDIILLQTLADGMIAVAYFSIPVLLLTLIRKRKRRSIGWMFWVFAIAFLLSGITHIFNIATIWQPAYSVEAAIKIATGAAWLITAVVLLKAIPQFLAMPMPEEMSAMNRSLAQQINLNRKSEERLRQLNADLERRVAERTAALERSNQDLMQFAYIASHDLQEPLRMVSNYTELLERRYASHLNEEARLFMRYAIDGARRMQELIGDLLMYAQIERDSVLFRPIEVKAAVDRALQSLRLALEEQMARVHIDELPVIVGDEAQMAQVFQNLLSNALKYRSEKVPEIRIWADLDESAGVWTFYVKDNGAGFDMKFKHRLFNMFQRLDTRQPGTGIGLALCKKIVQYHGGAIDVASEVGGGTTFFFTVPATNAPRAVI